MGSIPISCNMGIDIMFTSSCNEGDTLTIKPLVKGGSHLSISSKNGKRFKLTSYKTDS